MRGLCSGILAKSSIGQASINGINRPHFPDGSQDGSKECARFTAFIGESDAAPDPRLAGRKGVQAMPMVTPSLNPPTPTPSTSSSASMKPAGAPPLPALPAAPPPPTLPSAPSTTVTLSPQAMSLASGHSSSPSGTSSPSPAPAAQDGSIYDSLKNGISAAIDDVEGAISGGAHAVVDGVETALSTANSVATGIVELPFAAVAKTCDAAGALIDEL